MGSAIALIGASKRSKVRFLKGHNADHDNSIGLLKNIYFYLYKLLFTILDTMIVF